jgi:hypothetical protein
MPAASEPERNGAKASTPTPNNRKMLMDKILTIAVLVIVFAAIVLGVNASLLVKRYTNYTPYLASVPNPMNNSETMHANVVFRAETVSAQTQIFVDVKVFPERYPNANNMTNALRPSSTMLIVFDGATCAQDTDKFPFSDACEFQIKRNDDGAYRAAALLNYVSSGDFGVFLAEDISDSVTFTKSEERFIHIDSYQTTIAEGNFLMSLVVSVGAIIIGAIVAIWAARQR